MPEKAGMEQIGMGTGTSLIACGIFRHELESVLLAENGIAVHWLDAALHADAERMKAALDHAVAVQQDHSADRIPFLFGEGCHPDIGKVAEGCGSCIPPVKNCIQAIIGSHRSTQLEADRTMVITPGWITAWPNIMKGLGWDEIDVRINLGRYDRIVLIDTGVAPVSDETILAFMISCRCPSRSNRLILRISRTWSNTSWRSPQEAYRMTKTNPVFENYGDYLQQLDSTHMSRWEAVLDITVDEKRRTAQIPFFQTLYRVSPFGVVDDRGKRPDYGTCVILLKYLLMCPLRVPYDEDWISYRDFADTGQTQNVGLAVYAAATIAKQYTGGLEWLKTAVDALGGRSPETDYPYDLAAVLPALPRIPILFLFNDADEHFPARASVLYQRRAAHFLDAECRVMVDWYLLQHLKQAEPSSAHV